MKTDFLRELSGQSPIIAFMNNYGLIFDVDGVIADTEAVNAAASIQVFAEFFGIEGVKRADFAAGLGRGAEAYVKAAAKIHGLEMTDQQVAQATAARQEIFLKMLRNNPLPPFDGVMELIEAAMASEDFHLAIATSGTREKSQAVLESAGIPYKQMVYISGSEVTHKKPHPELFLKAVVQLGLQAQKCLVIEDAPNGVEAARAARCKCVAVTNSAAAHELAQADLVVDSLVEINLETIRELLR
ncbi:MAG: HAD family phosphatase [Sedimentisphaerales bacterium]|nr:HAD family phosphatase [Sedimentisphaerales bacterium]